MVIRVNPQTGQQEVVDEATGQVLFTPGQSTPPAPTPGSTDGVTIAQALNDSPAAQGYGDLMTAQAQRTRGVRRDLSGAIIDETPVKPYTLDDLRANNAANRDPEMVARANDPSLDMASRVQAFLSRNGLEGQQFETPETRAARVAAGVDVPQTDRQVGTVLERETTINPRPFVPSGSGLLTFAEEKAGLTPGTFTAGSAQVVPEGIIGRGPTNAPLPNETDMTDFTGESLMAAEEYDAERAAFDASVGLPPARPPMAGGPAVPVGPRPQPAGAPQLPTAAMPTASPMGAEARVQAQVQQAGQRMAPAPASGRNTTFDIDALVDTEAQRRRMQQLLATGTPGQLGEPRSRF